MLEAVLGRLKANVIDAATSRMRGEIFRDFRDDPNRKVSIISGSG